MPTVRRETPSIRPLRADEPPPSQKSMAVDAFNVAVFKDQCILDLAAGRHAKGCECEWSTTYTSVRELGGSPKEMTQVDYQPNACLHIAACARDFVGYDIDVEVGDASNTKPESL